MEHEITPLKVLALAIFVICGVAVLGGILGWFGEAAQVAHNEFGPKAALAKYTWFKDAAAQLESKQADIEVYARRLHSLEDAYKGTQRGAWPRSDREQHAVWESELAGVTASYNALAAEYNAQMAKFHWRFANAGELPPGATTPLPREFKPYRYE